MLPEFAEDVERLPDATRYWIEVEVSFDGDAEAQLDGLARIRLTNTTSTSLREIPIMLWPNHDQYASDMTVQSALVDGRVVALEPGESEVSMRVPLPEALSAGESVDISLPFEISAQRIMAAAPQRFGIAQGVLIAPTFYPLIPPFQGGGLVGPDGAARWGHHHIGSFVLRSHHPHAKGSRLGRDGGGN
jgi:hypothetical protein